MHLRAVDDMGSSRLAHRLIAQAIGEASARHPYVLSHELCDGPDAIRNLADAVHHLCTLHAERPGIIDLAAQRAPVEVTAWLVSAAANFTAERALVTQIMVAAPPMPSTPGQAECETTILAQRHALEMLARSERLGCAVGAALALLIDWQAVRGVLDTAADRLGLAPLPCRLPDMAAIEAFISRLPPAMERAVTFGATQLLIQQRGLWDLLESREQARR